MNQYVFEKTRPVVETKFGKIRGVTYGDVNLFMGVKYAKAKRFHMPEEQDKWEGIRDAYFFGPVSPLTRPNTPFALYRGLKLLQNESEDCQNLNIWAPKTLNGEKKPVFVWMHGGGFFAGNAFEEYSFDGFNMAHYGDVIFVSINHRLNIIAHMNMADYGPEFKNSVNVGIADLVAALKWIHENIAAFGGDPDNVTIAGHSGGGGKIQCMYQIEEAAPYFNRGMVLSGAMGGQRPDAEKNSKIVAKAVMDELGITKKNIDKVYDVSYAELNAAVTAATKKLAAKGIRPGWSPLKDDYYVGSPYDEGFAPWSANKPLLFGSTLGEFPTVKDLPWEKKVAMTQKEKVEYLKNRFGEHADKLMKLFKKAYPDHDIIDLAFMDSMVRIPTQKTALRHAENGLNNTWIYNCTYDAPEDGFLPLWHGGDVCYIFMNEDRVYALNEAIYGPKLANAFSTMTLNYVKYGNPNNKYMPEWKPITPKHHWTMVIDKEFACKEKYDDELVELYSKAAPPFRFGF